MDSTQAVDLCVRRLSPSVGAEITGIDVRALTSSQVARIKGLFLQHHLLVFPDQHLTDADIQRFAEHFGPLEGNKVRGVDGAVLPPVHRIANVDLQGRPSANPLLKSNYTWHTDKAYLPTPSLMTLLWGEEIPPVGGDTQFVSTEEAYDTLPTATKQRIESLRVIQSFKHMLDTLGQHDIIRADEIPSACRASSRANPSGNRPQEPLRRELQQRHRRHGRGRRSTTDQGAARACDAREIHFRSALEAARPRDLG